MKLYGLKNCDSCKKALREIKNAQKNIEFIDIRDNHISLEILQAWLDQHGDDVVVNRKSTTWRNLSDGERLTPALTLMRAHPTVIKRPIIVAGERIFVGWNADIKFALGIA